MSGENNLNEILQNGQKFTDVFVTPMVNAVRNEMQTHVMEVKKALEQVQGFEGRVSKLESNQTKALWGWGVFASGVAGAGLYCWNWVKGHIHIG